MRLIREVVDYLSGGNYDDVVRDLGPGFDVVEKVKKLWDQSGKTNTKSLRTKEFRVNLAQILLPERTRKDILEMGIGIGADLYKTVAQHVRGGGGVFAYESTGAGRSTHSQKAAVENEWVRRSVPTRQSNSNNETVRAVLGSLRKHALEIAKECGVSLASAFKFRPAFVSRRKNKQDICLSCETLLKLRHKAIKLANETGGEIKGGLDGPSQHLAREPGKDAAKFLDQNREFLGADGVELLRQIAVLEEHEDLAASLAEEMRIDIELATKGPGDVLVAQYDFRSVLDLHPVRGDSWDYYNCYKMNVMGLGVYVPGRDKPIFIDVISPDLRHDSEAGGVALLEGTKYVLNHFVDPAKLKRIAFWSDCGRHFRNRFIAYELLENNLREIPVVEIRYVGGNHGKCEVDGHFNWVGTCARNANSSWSDPPNDLLNAIQKSAEIAGNGYRVAPIFVEKLEFDHEPTMLSFTHVSVLLKISRVGARIYAEEREIKKKIQMVPRGEDRVRQRKTKPSTSQVVDTVANKCKKRKLLHR